MGLKIKVLMLACIIILSGCTAVSDGDSAKTATSQPLVQTTYALGTVITINLFDEGSDELMTRMIKRINDIERLMSSQLSDSEVSEIARNAGVEATIVSDDTYKVIERAVHYASLADGRFDPTAGPIIKLWGVGTKQAKVPEEAAIEEALTLINYKLIEMNAQDKTVFLPNKGMLLDLGSIAKGYAADELVKILKEEGITKAMIDLGGNIYAYGEKPGGKSWNVGIRTPYDIKNSYFGYVTLANKTVVTSGPYERFFEEDGQMYHHIFDARTGYPTSTEVVSVSIVADKSMDADALSTLLFTMTPEKGLELIETMEGIDCLYLDKDFNVTLSSGLIDVITLTDRRYHIVN